MKKMLYVMLIVLILAACTSVEPPPVPTEVPPIDTKIPPTDTKTPPILTPVPPTPDQTSDWPEYINTDLGYSFKYPSGCFFGPMPANCKENPPDERPTECLCFLDTENPYEVFMQALIAGEGEGFLMASFYVTHYDSDVFNPPAGVELISWLNENLSYPPQDLMPGETNYILDGVPAAWISIPGGQGGAPSDEIYFIWNNKLIKILMLGMEIDQPREIYENILSSFQLIE